MTLMVAGMVLSVLIGMLCRRRERLLRVAILALAASMTVLYAVFASRLM